ncbi:MAG: DUF1732 domain-containing protein [Candidatus Omnitrophota bacterium]
MKSMTAYASVHKRKNSQTIQVTLRSSNFKYLDISIHDLPAQNIILEERIKRDIKKRIARGKIEVYVSVKGHIENDVYIDEKNLARYIIETKKIAKKYHLEPRFDISDLFNLPQVISWSEKKTEEQFILSAARAAIEKLLRFKEKQGGAIKKDMTKNLKHLKKNIELIKSRNPMTIRSESGKEDINEEVSLASFYVADLEKKINFQRLISQGKSIDFLTQEILRELNSASSKTKDRTIAPLLVESKNYLDRIREQAQNVE